MHSRLYSKILSLFLAAVCLPLAATAEVITLSPKDATRLTELGIQPKQWLDYGSFVWIELDAQQLRRLEDVSIPANIVEDARQVRVMGHNFDPILSGEPKFLPSLTASPAETGFRLVQCIGPARQEWLDELNSSGSVVLQYYPHNTYLIWNASKTDSDLLNLPFVRWVGLFHPAYKINKDLEGRPGLIENVDILFYNGGDFEATIDTLKTMGVQVLQYNKAQPDGLFYSAIVKADASLLETVARHRNILWMGHESTRSTLDDEMSDQTMAGNHPGGLPVTGYQAHLTSLGVDGTGVRWAVIDTGVDYNHPDLGPHIVGGYTFPGACATNPGEDCSGGGHGTHVAGIIGGTAAGGFADGEGFLYGLGVAPNYEIFAMNSLSASAWPPTGGWQEHSKRAVLGGAIGGNNSWTTGEGTNHGYQASERTHDIMVRDGNFDTTSTAEPFIEVFSAGNSGPSANTLTAPKEAKNLIVVASSTNFDRAGASIDTLSGFSSRGPSVDGRIVPTITTPGEQIASSRNDLGGSCSTAISGTNNLYAFCSGTSMASPHAAGAVVLLTEWWRGFNSNADPSPAMAKALLVNTAVDMGTADIPHFNEGWGRVNVTKAISPGVSVEYWDQTTTLDNTGEQFIVNLGVPDPNKPVKITLAWSDAPGAAGANPAIVNNLDLVVNDGPSTYLGNRFTSGWSATGGSADTKNNLENVFIQSPSGGSITITINATNLAGDGVPYTGDTTDQDFALICSNCALTPDFTLAITPGTNNVCAPSNGTYTVDVGSILSFNESTTLSVTGNPASTTTNFSTNPVTPPGSSTLTIGNTGAAAAGSYTLEVTGVSATKTHSRDVGFNLFTAAPSAPTLQSPADGAGSQPTAITLTWNAATQGSTYHLQVATDSGFSNIVVDADQLTQTTYNADLSTATQYYWRVSSTNACSTGSNSSTFTFSTQTAPGDCSIGITPTVLYQDDMESSAPGWTHSATLGTDSWALNSLFPNSGTKAWNASGPGTAADQRLVSPAIVIPPSAVAPSLRFYNRQSIEDNAGTACYDGAILEVSTDGTNFTQIPNGSLLTDPYDGLVGSGFQNPLVGLSAWCGDPQPYLESRVDLAAYVGQTVTFRFRMGTDSTVGRSEGWSIDDVLVQECSGGATPTVTPTGATSTPTATRTATNTPTGAAATSTPTATNPAATTTPTHTATSVPSTSTPTATPTNTPTNVPSTSTPTHTPTNAPPTSTPTHTATEVPPTWTPTPTSTEIPSVNLVLSEVTVGSMVEADGTLPSGQYCFAIVDNGAYTLGENFQGQMVHGTDVTGPMSEPVAIWTAGQAGSYDLLVLEGSCDARATGDILAGDDLGTEPGLNVMATVPSADLRLLLLLMAPALALLFTHRITSKRTV